MESEFWLKFRRRKNRTGSLAESNFIIRKFTDSKTKTNLSQNSISMMIKIGRAQNFTYALSFITFTSLGNLGFKMIQGRLLIEDIQ